MSLAVRIREAYLKAGYSQKELAEVVGVSPPAVSQWVSKEDSTVPSGPNIIKIATACGVSPDWLIYGGSGAPKCGHESDKKLPVNFAEIIPLSNVKVIGRVKAGHFFPAEEWETVDFRLVPLPVNEKYADIPRYGLMVEGDSMDLEFRANSILVCSNLTDIGRWPLDGEFIIIHRYNSSGELEATCKQYHIDKNGVGWAMPRSTNPEHTPIRLHGPEFTWGEDSGLDMDDSQVGAKIQAIVQMAVKTF